MQKENEREATLNFNLVDIFITLWKKRILVLIIVLASFAVSIVYGMFFVTPKYVSTTKIYVVGAANADNILPNGGISSNELTISNYLVTDFSKLIIDRSVIEEVISRLKLDASFEQIKNLITVTDYDDSRVLEISVSSTDPKLSKSVADTICVVSSKQMKDFLGVDKINQFGEANLPVTNSAISVIDCGLLGIGIGIVISILMAVIILMKNDKIQTPEDVENYLGFCTLAYIPYNAAKAKEKSAKRKAAKKR